MSGKMGAIDVKEDEAFSKMIHTRDASEQYHIGDCYERAPITLEWELDTAKLPYLAHIKSLASSWKPLRHLADWMEVGTSPLRWKHMREGERKERAYRTNVTMIEHLSDHTVTEAKLTSRNALKKALTVSLCAESEGLAFRMFLVEDLSQQVIELLGSRYDVDPLFFREQVADYNWFNTRDPWAMAPSLMASMKHRNWFRLRHVRFRYLKSDESFKRARRESNRFNIFRRPDNDESHWGLMDAKGAIVTMTRTRTTTWIGKDPDNPQVTVAIILIDPTISEGRPLWYGPTNWSIPPSLKQTEPAPTTSPESLYDLIVQATISYPWFPSSTPQHFLDPQTLACPTLFTVCAEWLVLCEYLKARLAQLEWELEKPDLFRSKDDVIDSSLQRLHVWRRMIPVLREMITETIEHALPSVNHLIESIGGSNTSVNEITADFLRVRQNLNELQSRVDRLTAVVTSGISREDARRGLVENRNISRLTWLATTFVPLNFIAGLFSMTENISAMGITFGWYFLTAVPLTAFTLVVAWLVGTGFLRKWTDALKNNIWGSAQ